VLFCSFISLTEQEEETMIFSKCVILLMPARTMLTFLVKPSSATTGALQTDYTAYGAEEGTGIENDSASFVV